MPHVFDDTSSFGQAAQAVMKTSDKRRKSFSRRMFMSGFGGATAILATPFAQATRNNNDSNWAVLELLDQSNRTFKISQLVKPFTLIVLWANWCGKCMKELALLPQLAAETSVYGIDMLLVSHPDDWLLNQKVIRERNLHVHCARPSAANSRALLKKAFASADGVFYVPRAILFSKEGRNIVWDHIGELTYASEAAIGSVQKRLST